MADERVRDPFGCMKFAPGEQTDSPEEGSIAMVCLFTFAATAAATLIVCIVTPAPPISETWRPFLVDRTAKGKVSGSASAAS